MSNDVANPDPLARLRAADPVDLEELGSEVAPLRSRMLENAISLGEEDERWVASARDEASPASSAGSVPRRSGFLTRRRGLSLGFGSLACAAILAAVIVFSGGSIESVRQGARPGFADAAVRVAEANPRFLVTAPGWRVIEAKSFRPETGALVFGNGHQQIRLVWSSADEYPEIFKLPPAIKSLPDSTVAGRKAVNTVLPESAEDMVDPAGLKYFNTFLPPEGGVFVSLDGAFADGAEWKALMASVRAVSVDSWLGAMPAEVVRPRAMSTELARMLRGVTVPPGFDASAAVEAGGLVNRFQTAKMLTGAVTCGWVRRWASARRDGDAGTAEEAVDAMAGARHWPVLLRMVREKGYRGDALPTSGYGWPAALLAIGQGMAAGHLAHEPLARAADRRDPRKGFLITAGATPSDWVVCEAPK